MSDDVVVILGRGVRRSAAEHGAAVGLGHRVRHRVALLRGQSVNQIYCGPNMFTERDG